MGKMTPVMKPNALIIRTAGTNCDRELGYAFELAGASVRNLHLNQLIDEPDLIKGIDVIGLPGGFSYGDDIAAGRIFANRLRHRLLEPLRTAVGEGTAIIGICNGFQVLVKMGLLPDPGEAMQQATLATNTSGRFIDRWVELEVPEETVCVWTRGLGRLSLPIAHGEGRFLAASATYLERWRDQGQIALRYAAEDNPNGSEANVAGFCDPSGRVLGLMPHPERCVDSRHDPRWTRRSPQEPPAGLQLIRNAFDHLRTPTLSRA